MRRQTLAKHLDRVGVPIFDRGDRERCRIAVSSGTMRA